MRQNRAQPLGRAVLAAVLALCVSATASSAADVVVHLVNARTGRPIAHKPIRMWLLDGPPYRGRPGYLEQKTGSDGTAVFQLSEPLPARVDVRTGMGGYWEECPPNPFSSFDLRVVLTGGISEEGPCPPSLPRIDRRFVPKPGELYLFVSHLSLRERITHCGEWGCK